MGGIAPQILVKTVRDSFLEALCYFNMFSLEATADLTTSKRYENRGHEIIAFRYIHFWLDREHCMAFLHHL
jgi:hypothetical protein